MKRNDDRVREFFAQGAKHLVLRGIEYDFRAVVLRGADNGRVEITELDVEVAFVGRRGDLVADSDVAVKLLIDLSAQCLSRSLAGLDLSSGELPHATQAALRAALSTQDLAIANDASADNVDLFQSHAHSLSDRSDLAVSPIPVSLAVLSPRYDKRVYLLGGRSAMAGESARESAKRLREKAERQARVAEMFERGAEGEEATAAALAGLPAEEWTVFHDLRWPGRKFANVDHIAVGPPGVYVIDSKNWSGSITVADNVLRQNGRARETAVHGAAEAAMAVSGLARSVSPLQIHPVICFVRDEQVVGWARDAMLCSTSNLVGMLTSREPVLPEDVRRMVVLELDAALRSATEPAATPSPARYAPRRQYVTSRRPTAIRSRRPPRGSRRGGCMSALLGAVATVVAVSFGINVITQVLGSGSSAGDVPAQTDGSCPGGHTVKAWTNKAGLLVYREANTSHYAKAHAERCYVDAAHAERAGFTDAER